MYYFTKYVEKTNPFAKRLKEPELDDGVKGLVLLKAFTLKTLSTTMYKQIHCFVLMKHPHLAFWQDVYAEDRKRVGDTIPALSIWLKDRVLATKGTIDRVDDITQSLILGPTKKA